ncbi:peptidyl-prolyl cis-trans isomerase CYP59-like [Solanum stenotomum]|uniref:peptidyl-prolyl cis-trans isomerase CYP59-like n=1 Tax=Solanum stenotomum TaxID=172797 RepID=UPI0020D1F4DB|nr:peptidyl-prolyl cis-trans isomerase CYP59-like [Solanum stenotomum]
MPSASVFFSCLPENRLSFCSSVMIRTSLGDMGIDLFTSLTCKIFSKLCKINYYDGCDSVVQTGDDSYKFLYGDQARHSDLKRAMASAGENNLNATKLRDTDLDNLDGKRTVSGERDLLYAEIKPRVLWVCNLNSVTEDEDLYTIFSRFGTVASAEIIRDRETGDSHCYGFIEFEDNEACELAYFKMINAVIDDRRIHVGFSQSVAKSWNQY